MKYDYIVIGAGSSGCAVASRLSEDGTTTVLLVEAGPADTDPSIHVPAAFPTLFKTPLDWDYSSTGQTGLNGRQLYMPRGKVYGGSSSINAMIYQRGNPACYDGWNAGGVTGWGWKNVLPYFKRLENYERGASEFHGVGGPLNVADLRDPNPLTVAFVEAAIEQGFPHNPDFNDGEQEGFGLYQVTQKNGMRASASVSYLQPAMTRTNLTIQGNALTRRLLIEEGRCTGVAYELDGKEQIAEARKEVVVCAGAFGSPHLLMLSGIGPKAHLESHGIKVVKDLSGVGQNLQDHYMAPVAYTCTEPVSLAGASDPSQLEKLSHGMGLLTSNIGEAGGFVTVTEGSAAPDLQFHFAPAFFVLDGSGNPAGHGFTLMPGVVGTKSKGQVTLSSSDPTRKPNVDPGCLNDEHDIDIIVAGLKIARRILNSEAMAPFRGAEVLPGPAVQSDAALREFVRNYTQTIYHPVGTCKMGFDAMAVVDHELKVHGIKGLRVADASIMPAIINANTNAPSIMIGEKCADMIRMA